MTYEMAKLEELDRLLGEVHQLLMNFNPQSYTNAVSHLCVRENVSPTPSSVVARKLRTRLTKTQQAVKQFKFETQVLNEVVKKEIDSLYNEV